MEDIAAGVGIGRSALYGMFPSKEALFRALVNALIEEIDPVLPADLGDRPAPDLMRQVVAALADRLTRGDVAFLPRLIVGEGAQFPDLVRYYHDHAMARVLGAVEQVIRHGNARDEFVVPDPALAARSVAGGIVLMVLWRNVFEPAGVPKIDARAMAAHHAELVLRGMMAR
ncbi:MAG: hypothetical protein RIS94_3429 [Pseudomonadota bacterium]